MALMEREDANAARLRARAGAKREPSPVRRAVRAVKRLGRALLGSHGK